MSTTIQTRRLSANASCSYFASDTGCREYFFAIHTNPGVRFTKALDELSREYGAALEAEGLSDATVVFSRLFTSDYINQKESIDSSGLLVCLRQGALSVIEQKPVGGGQFSLFSYHILRHPGATFTKQISCNGATPKNSITACLDNYRLLFTANYDNNETFDAYAQTTEIFKEMNQSINLSGMNLLDNTIRTWIYVRDIDNHYKNMVRSRKEFFSNNGLTEKTRYLASTGIEGAGSTPANLVTIDSLSIGGLVKGQIVRMEALTHLSPTILYNVTFERGLKVTFGDRSHLYISGTASINNKGDVLHVGDVEMQTRRTLENLKILLSNQGATIKDMAYLMVYIRSFQEWNMIRRVIVDEIGETIPLIAFEAKVCRPSWLFELEGVAIIPDNANFPPFA